MLAQVPLPRGALAAVAAQLKQYTAAREQHLLAVADQATTAASIVATEDTPAQQWQVRGMPLPCTMLLAAFHPAIHENASSLQLEVYSSQFFVAHVVETKQSRVGKRSAFRVTADLAPSSNVHLTQVCGQML